MTFSDVISATRASVVRVQSPTSVGSGYCALPNGLIVTSLDVVGYEREVVVTLDDGNAVSAIVLRANVALDVALLLTVDPHPLTPLPPGAEARIGDQVTTVGRVGMEPFIVRSHVTSTGRVAEGFAHLQLDGACEDALRGAPVVDSRGGVLGFITRPRRTNLIGDRSAHRWLAGLCLPTSAYEGGLMSAEGPREELLDLLPEYGCPRCDTIFEPDMDRCLECGVSLPHQWQHRLLEPAPGNVDGTARGFFAVKAALASLGIPANRARVGLSTWRFCPEVENDGAQVQVDVTADASGDNLVLRAPVARLPMEGFEHFYRHLLTLNDESAGAYRFGVLDRTVYLSLFEPVLSLDATSFPQTVAEFSQNLRRHQAALSRHFNVEVAFEHDVD